MRRGAGCKTAPLLVGLGLTSPPPSHFPAPPHTSQRCRDAAGDVSDHTATAGTSISHPSTVSAGLRLKGRDGAVMRKGRAGGAITSPGTSAKSPRRPSREPRRLYFTPILWLGHTIIPMPLLVPSGAPMTRKWPAANLPPKVSMCCRGITAEEVLIDF